MAKKAKLPAGPNKSGKSIVDPATGEQEQQDPVKAAVAALGRPGVLKGGNARAKSLMATKRLNLLKGCGCKENLFFLKQ